MSRNTTTKYIFTLTCFFVASYLFFLLIEVIPQIFYPNMRMSSSELIVVKWYLIALFSSIGGVAFFRKNWHPIFLIMALSLPISIGFLIIQLLITPIYDTPWYAYMNRELAIIITIISVFLIYLISKFYVISKSIDVIVKKSC